MKRFLAKILVFVFVLLVLAIPADIIMTRQFSDTTDFRYAVWNDILKGGMKNDIVVMGSSRSWVQISPQILDSVLHTNTYNIGMDGSCIDRQIPRYKIYRKYNAKPKIILQEVGWGSTLQYGGRDSYLIEQYFPYFYNADMREMVIKPEGFDFFDFWMPMVRYVRYKNLGQILHVVRGLSNPEMDVKKGYKGIEKDWDGSHLDKIDSIYFRYNESSLVEFCDYLADCNKDSVQVVFVYPPFYADGTQKVVNLTEFYSLFDSVADEYNVRILNYLEDEMCSDTAYFYNAMHLNKRGSEKFSRILAHDLDSIGLIDK